MSQNRVFGRKGMVNQQWRAVSEEDAMSQNSPSWATNEEIFNPALSRTDPITQLRVHYRCAVEVYHAVKGMDLSDLEGSSVLVGRVGSKELFLDFLQDVMSHIVDTMQALKIEPLPQVEKDTGFLWPDDLRLVVLDANGDKLELQEVWCRFGFGDVPPYIEVKLYDPGQGEQGAVDAQGVADPSPEAIGND